MIYEWFCFTFVRLDNMAESRSVEVKEVNRNDSHHLNNGT